MLIQSEKYPRNRYGEPLVLLLEEGCVNLNLDIHSFTLYFFAIRGVLTDCNIRTMVASTPTGIDIRSAEVYYEKFKF